MKKLLLVLLLLSACATDPTAVVTPDNKIIHIDLKILELCMPLVKLPDNSTFYDIITINLKNIEVYAACANKQKNSSDLLKQISNIQEGK